MALPGGAHGLTGHRVDGILSLTGLTDLDLTDLRVTRDNLRLDVRLPRGVTGLLLLGSLAATGPVVVRSWWCGPLVRGLRGGRLSLGLVPLVAWLRALRVRGRRRVPRAGGGA
ncbi:hypothetical protein [Longispora fulva]|uniref:Uncharacterized protein n=1 Tax=Longispora fulva TaxID=619741 RepID=A0A8J7GXQ0_9ACTN|nr:hypothetical protein [Longispora fulva]MBG6139981.1 hypothetical protein [Longispora fulva]